MLPRIFPPDNSPESLLKLTVKFILLKEIPIKNVNLPVEICNILLEVFRDLNQHSKDAEKVSKFISQFKAHSTPLSYARLSSLPLRDRDILHLLSEHHNTLKHLDIDGCQELTQNSLHYILTLSNRMNDFDHLIVTVKITEGSFDDKIVSTLFEKKYEKGVITNSLGICESTHVGVKKDLLSIFEAMNVFEYGFDNLRREISCIRDNYVANNYTNTTEKFEALETPQKPLFCHSPGGGFSFPNSSTQEPTISSYMLSTFEVPVISSDTVSEVTNLGTVRSIEYKAWRKPPLENLIIGNSSQIFPGPDWRNLIPKEKLDPPLPLRAFVLHNLIPQGQQFGSHSILDLIVSSTMSQTLTYLDLSNCGILITLLNLENLRTLILYNTQIGLPYLRHLKKLRYLDISTSFERVGHSYEFPDTELAKLVESLPELTHLDISGTNLAGDRSDRIIGLESRYDRPLEFLGVYNSSDNGSFRPCLPALKIAGEANEEQILVACEVYMDRSELLTKALNDLFHCFRNESDFHDIIRSLNVVLTAMERHSDEKPIQIAASASLFYMVKSNEAKSYSSLMKRPIVSRLLDAMQRFQNDSTMLRNGSLTLIHFKLPHDVLFEYPRVVKLLLFIVMNEEEEFIQRLGIYLLNSLACNVDGEQKTLIGDLGAIEKLVKLIQIKLSRNQCDEVMEMAWSTIWNVTDENPLNCQRFLQNSGMNLFVDCMEAFPNPPELLRNMMGLLGNVAECENLRPRLMKRDYIERFSALLESESDGIEVSYNAAGILSHIVSDGEEVWNKHLPGYGRETVLPRMRAAISRWRINSRRNINYRSFEPIFRLLRNRRPVYEAQCWAVWALANLTRVYSTKYCPLFLKGGGEEILKDLLKDENLPEYVRKLVVLTLSQVHRWSQLGTLDALENDASIEIEP